MKQSYTFGDTILDFIKENKKRNIPLVLSITALVYFIIAYNLSSILNKTLGKEKYSLKLFFTNESDIGRTVGLVLTTIIFLYLLYLMFFGKAHKKDSENNLGSAQLGSTKKLNGLTGTDGMLLSKKVQLNSNACFEHIAIIGPTGAGKSSTFFIPNLLNLPPEASIVISDPKGELYQKTKDYNESIGRKCILFAPLEPKHSSYYNPIEIANSVTEIREIAQNLLINGANAIALATGKSGGGDSEWINMSVPLWTAALLFCKTEGGELGNINAALNLILEKDEKELDFIFTNASKDVQSQYNIFKMSSGSEKTVSSIKTVLASNLQLFTDPNIVTVTQKSEFHPYILKDVPTAIYIMCPERRSSYASPFMSVFYSQVINKIMEYKGKDLPVYMMLDEFANIGMIPNFGQLAATCRSRKLSLTVGIQGIEQLYQNYGKENGDSILNNLKSKIFYPGLAPATAQVASQLSGFTTVAVKSKSEGKEKNSKSTSMSYQRRELLDADEVRRLPGDEILLVLHNREPLIDKQNRYYENKTFLSRLKEHPLPVRDDYKEEDGGAFASNYSYLAMDKK